MENLRDDVIRAVAIKTGVPLNIVRIIYNEWSEGINNVFPSEAETMEISGFGRFKFNRIMLKRRMIAWKRMEREMEEKLNDSSVSGKQRQKLEIKLANIKGDMEYMKKYKHGALKDIGGMEE